MSTKLLKTVGREKPKSFPPTLFFSPTKGKFREEMVCESV